MLENFEEELETIKFVNISYVKNEYGEMVKTETITENDVLVTNGTARVSTNSGSVEFIDYKKINYESGELSKGDQVEINNIRYNVTTEPKNYSSHMKVEVVRSV